VCLRGGVPEGGDPNDPVAVPLDGLAELDVECLAGRGIRVIAFLHERKQVRGPVRGSGRGSHEDSLVLLAGSAEVGSSFRANRVTAQPPG
jgi:hypothetical protein